MAKKTFETALAKLEQITSELESGELSLDKSLKKFDEGIRLVQYCNEQLEQARTRVEVLLTKNDQLETRPLSTSDNGDQNLS